MAVERFWALGLVVFGFAGLAGSWATLPTSVLLVGVAWLPGRILADCLRARYASDDEGLDGVLGGPGALSVELALSLALLVPVFVPFFLLEASLGSARTAYAVVLALLGHAGLFFVAARPRVSERWEWATAGGALVLLVPVVLSYAGATIDDWWDLSFIRAYVERPALSFAEPLLGSDAMHPRFAWNSWYVVQALVLETRFDQAVAFQAAPLALFVCVAVVSAQACLARVVFGARDRVALGAAIAAVPLWLYGTEALPFFTRLHQDKFVAGLVLVPVLLSAALVCLRSDERRHVVLLFAVALAACATHSLVFGIGVIGVAALALTELRSEPKPWSAIARTATATLPLLLYPLGQALVLRGRFGAQGIALSERDNPVVLAHLSLDRLLWTDSAAYVVNPTAVFGPIAVLAVVGVAISLRNPKTRWARVAAVLAVLPSVLIFIPGVAALTGTALVPWMIYRVGWLVPVPLLLGVVFAAAWRSRRRFVWSAAVVLSALMLVLPLADDRLTRGMREHPSAREWGPRGTTKELYNFVSTLPPTALVAAQPGLSRLIPSMSGRATLAMSERATLVFSSGESAAYERLRARAAFFADDAELADRADIASRYGLTHAVFRRRWISAGSDERWLGGATGPGFVLLLDASERRTQFHDRDALLAALPAGTKIAFENADFFAVELAVPARNASAEEDADGDSWSSGFGVSSTSIVPVGSEIVASAVRYPGAEAYFHPPPVALGATAFPVWTSGGEVWDDAPTAVRVVIKMRGECAVETVEVRPYLPTRRRDVFEITIGDVVERHIAKHKAPIFTALDGKGRSKVEVGIRSMLGGAFGLADVRLHARIDSCDAHWEPTGAPEWPQTELSIEEGMRLARLYPHRAAGALALATVLAEDERSEDGLAVLRSAILSSRDETVPWIEMGLLEDGVGGFDDAVTSFKAAVANDSNSAWARGCLAWAELRRRRLPMAAWHAWVATRLDHDYADAYTILAAAAKRLGLRAAARSLLETSLDMDRYRSWGYLELARMIDEDGDREAAVRLLEEFLVLVPFDLDARALLEHFTTGARQS